MAATTETSKRQPIDDDTLNEMIEERVRLGSLQVQMPASHITVLPNAQQLLLLAPNHKTAGSKLSLQIMNIENNESNEYGQAFDFSSLNNVSTELTLEQKLLRERQRTSAHGITSYSYHTPTNQVLFNYGPHLVIGQIPAGGQQLITKFNSIPLVKLGDANMDTMGSRMDAKLTADGAFVVFARNNDLWLTSTRPNLLSSAQPTEIRLTFAQNISADITAGVADFINEEEFDRYTGYWPCDRYQDIKLNDADYREYSILYLEADNSKVPTITIPSMDGIEQHKWPRAGETNCSFKVKIVRVAVPLACCAQTVGDAAKAAQAKIADLDKQKVVLRDYELKQSIYASFEWIEYIVRAGWTQRNNECWIQYLDRDQMKSSVVMYQFETHFTESSNDSYGAQENDGDDKKMQNNEQNVDAALRGQQLFYLEGTPWINIHDAYRFIKNGVIWLSQHTGFSHLYYIPYPEEKDSIDVASDSAAANVTDATLVNQRFLVSSKSKLQTLTSGQWEVEAEEFWLDEQTNTIYFNGRRETHLEKQLYCVSFDATKPSSTAAEIKQLTQSGFFHDAKVDAINFKYFTSVYSSISKPRQFAVYSIDGKCVKEFAVPYRGNPSKLQYVEPILMEVKNLPADMTDAQRADDAFIKLHTFSAVVYPAFDPEYQKTKEYKKGGYPTIISVYGGPHAQLVTNSWDRMTGNSRVQLWRTLGYTVAVIDGRGSFHRGLAFEGRLKYKMGQIEIQDQVKLVEHLNGMGLTDPNKVAITGYSYGGYMSLMALCQRPDVFKLGIAGAPVTLWELYDTGYTERYMGTPQKQPNGYRDGSVLKYVANFPDEAGRVLIIHGLADENVHFYHTSKLLAAMIQAKKPYDLKIFPGERHGIRQFHNVLYMERYVIENLQQTLQ